MNGGKTMKINRLIRDPKTWQEAISELKSENPKEPMEVVGAAAARLYPDLRDAAVKGGA
jgi:hypothetical protein